MTFTWRDSAKYAVAVVYSGPKTQVANLSSYLLRAWKSCASKSEIRNEFALQGAELFSEKQFAEVTIDSPPFVAAVSVIALFHLFH